ncbi:arylsulfatase [Blastomonas aquatica]|uniref:Arylsulfatase n=1 Tax=Blastomonas aquatica TaxID=1510276 RepID=A0ABQ1JBB4_9SPHN|nr:arylsulfatase [Blastomonas aquatica]GGB64507.1 arylsulfatase [Blastomonas aquatica]
MTHTGRKVAVAIIVGVALTGLGAASVPRSAPNPVASAASSSPAPVAAPVSVKPNFVVLLADDLALMDLGIYGGEAATPNIDALALRGRMFTRYYSSPLCSPSRAMLLTGLDNHRTGVSTIQEMIPPEQTGKKGYSLRFEPGVTTISERLQGQGYRTYMTGKWHLGHGQGDLPVDHGFDRSFILDASGADNWEQKSYMPYYKTAPWFEDAKPATLPADFYSSRFLIDKMIDYIDSGSADQPFFAYVGFQAVHIPVQAPAEFTRKYADTYREGWAVMRKARWQRAQAIGLIPQGAPLADPPQGLRAWESLSAQEQALFARHMAINAGMIEAMDHHIGRLVTHLKRTGQYDNTVFVFASDNGPEPSNPMAGARSMDLWTRTNGYSVSADNWGEKGTYGFIGPEFANAAASPGAMFKFYTSEGGLHVPMIIAGPGIAPGQPSSAMTVVSDIAPTLLALAGGKAEAGAFDGTSLVPLLTGEREEVRSAEVPVGFEVSGNAALFKGSHKLVRNLKPYGDGQWRLFDISSDPGETRDLSEAEPAKFQELMADYRAYASRNGVLEMPEGYDSTTQIGINTVKKMAGHYWWVLAGMGLLIIAALYGIFKLVRRSSGTRPA